VLASWFLTWEGKTTEIGKIIKSGKQVAFLVIYTRLVHQLCLGIRLLLWPLNYLTFLEQFSKICVRHCQIPVMRIRRNVTMQDQSQDEHGEV
jgi:succinate dehydrogenase/fumarate reductase cytochrome b subunit